MTSEFEHGTRFWESQESQWNGECDASRFDEFWGGTKCGVMREVWQGSKLAKICQQCHMSVMGCNTLEERMAWRWWLGRWVMEHQERLILVTVYGAKDLSQLEGNHPRIMPWMWISRWWGRNILTGPPERGTSPSWRSSNTNSQKEWMPEQVMGPNDAPKAYWVGLSCALKPL